MTWHNIIHKISSTIYNIHTKYTQCINPYWSYGSVHGLVWHLCDGKTMMFFFALFIPFPRPFKISSTAPSLQHVDSQFCWFSAQMVKTCQSCAIGSQLAPWVNHRGSIARICPRARIWGNLELVMILRGTFAKSVEGKTVHALTCMILCITQIDGEISNYTATLVALMFSMISLLIWPSWK